MRAVSTDGGYFDRHGVVRHHDVGIDPVHTRRPRERLQSSAGEEAGFRSMKFVPETRLTIYMIIGASQRKDTTYGGRGLENF